MSKGTAIGLFSFLGRFFRFGRWPSATLCRTICGLPAWENSMTGLLSDPAKWEQLDAES
jgi:hypothetical protein